MDLKRHKMELFYYVFGVGFHLLFEFKTKTFKSSIKTFYFFFIYDTKSGTFNHYLNQIYIFFTSQQFFLITPTPVNVFIPSNSFYSRTTYLKVFFFIIQFPT